jgi:hypothetical protein
LKDLLGKYWKEIVIYVSCWPVDFVPSSNPMQFKLMQIPCVTPTRAAKGFATGRQTLSLYKELVCGMKYIEHFMVYNLGKIFFSILNIQLNERTDNI